MYCCKYYLFGQNPTYADILNWQSIAFRRRASMAQRQHSCLRTYCPEFDTKPPPPKKKIILMNYLDVSEVNTHQRKVYRLHNLDLWYWLVASGKLQPQKYNVYEREFFMFTLYCNQILSNTRYI